MDGPKDLAFLCEVFGAKDVVEIDLAEITWMSPLGVVAILTACLATQDKGCHVRVAPPVQPQVTAYLAGVGFFEVLRTQGWSTDDVDHVAGTADLTCVKVAALESEADVNRLGEQLLELFTPFVSTNTASHAYDAITELTSNAREHGRKPGSEHPSCYVTAQLHTGKTSQLEGIVVATADFGPGFAHHLQHVLPHAGDLSDADAIVGAFKEGVSSTLNKHRGLGLSNIQRDLDSYPGARLTIVSQGGIVTRSGQAFQADAMPAPFHGTVAMLYLPCPVGSPA